MLQPLKDLPLWLRLWLVFPLGCLNIWLILFLFHQLQPLSSQLIVAIILAFLLNFPIRFLQKRGLTRGLAIGLVFCVALLLLALLSLILVPLIIEELSDLVIHLPELINSGSQQLQAVQQWAITQQFPGNLNELTERSISQLSQLLQATGNQVLSVILGTINSLINIMVLLVLTTFMVIGGEQAWDGLFSWLPSTWSQPLQVSIQKTFQGYFASQALLSLFLSIAQTVVLSILGLPYAVLYGVSIGIASLIPYASPFVMILVSLLVALDNFRMGINVLGATVIVGLINDNVLAPRLLGHRIGLNPIWLIVSLLLGGKFAGIVGLVIAVPVASVIKQMGDNIRLSSESRLNESIDPVHP